MARNSTTFKPGHKAKGGRPPGSLSRRTIEVREFARRFIEDSEYQTSLRRRMIAGKAPQMEMLLFSYAYGKPVERHEVSAYADRDHSGRKLIIDGREVTQEGAERLRRLMAGIIDYSNKEGAKVRAAGELPNATTPPGMPA
jgi:hypothetical protein